MTLILFGNIVTLIYWTYRLFDNRIPAAISFELDDTNMIILQRKKRADYIKNINKVTL